MIVNIMPFGDVVEDRFELSKKYKLVEMTGGFWRLTPKCSKNYDRISYIEYLKGKTEIPIKIGRDAIIKGLLDL